MNQQTEEALRMAIEGFENIFGKKRTKIDIVAAYEQCKAALQEDALDRMAENATDLGLEWQGEREPLGWIPATYKYNLMSNDEEYPIGAVYRSKKKDDDVAIYTRPTKPLSDDEIEQAWLNSLKEKAIGGEDWVIHFARAIEKAHGIGK